MSSGSSRSKKGRRRRERTGRDLTPPRHPLRGCLGVPVVEPRVRVEGGSRPSGSDTGVGFRSAPLGSGSLGRGLEPVPRVGSRTSSPQRRGPLVPVLWDSLLCTQSDGHRGGLGPGPSRTRFRESWGPGSLGSGSGEVRLWTLRSGIEIGGVLGPWGRGRRGRGPGSLVHGRRWRGPGSLGPGSEM